MSTLFKPIGEINQGQEPAGLPADGDDVMFQMWLPVAAVALLCLAGPAYMAEHNSTAAEQPRWCSAEQTTCGLYEDDGPWMAMVQQWALTGSDHNGRQGTFTCCISRICSLSPRQAITNFCCLV